MNSLGQTTYYVASTGKDTNNGTSMTAPFQTLVKVNSLSLRPGDVVLFRRGDTFQGTLTIRKSGSANLPITFDAYGNGPKPILSGSVPVSNWSAVGGNVWQASCSSCGSAVTGLYRDGVGLPLGRYPNADAPNKGNLTIRAHTERYQIFSLEHLPTTIDWQGAEVVMRPTAWIIDRAVVDHQYGDALNLFNYSTYTPKDNSEYFFQNHPATLDRQGEWCYTSANKSLQVYDTTGCINDRVITATVSARAVDIANSSYLSLRNLQITQTLNTNVFTQNVSNLTLINLDITNAGEDGLAITGSGTNLLLENNTVTNVNNNGISIDTYQTVTLKGNTIRAIGAVTGRGKSGDGMYNGVASKANKAVSIENNTIDSVGYNGITFGNNTTIRQNVISNYCISKVDGGGIYAWNGNKTSMTNINILSNIIFASPNVRGKYAYQDYSIGIFLDDCVENVAIRNNTIFGNTQWGVFLHGNPNIVFTDNTLFDNFASQLVVYHNGGVCPIRNDIITRNIIVSKLPSQLVAQYESNANDLFQYGLIDSNYYARPFDETATILGIMNSTQGGRYELNDWKNFSGGLDLHSKGSPITYKPYKNEGAGGTSRVNSTFDTNNDNWFLIYSRYNNGEVVRDNSNKLDGGSLRVGFSTPSGQSDSYAQAVKPVALTKGKTYVLRFDAIATVNVNLLVYLRQYGAPFKEYDRRYSVPLGTTRKSFEFPFTPSDSDTNAVILVQIDGEGPTFWLDNIRLQEDVPIQNNPDDFIKLYYNPTLKDSTIKLTGLYRDVKNQAYSGSVLLKPFTSIILLKDTIPVSVADLSLSLETDKRVLRVNETTRLSLRVTNQGTTPATLSRWTYRLPTNLQLICPDGQPYSDNVLTGTVSSLEPMCDTTFTFLVKPTANGLFRTAAQITTATSPDPDSTPNSGTADGEDDAAVVEFRVGGLTTNVYESPNPNQRPLSPIATSQPAPNVTTADLSLRMQVSKRAPTVGQIITLTLFVNNAGGGNAQSVQLENELPSGLELYGSTNWTVNGRSMSITLPSVSANTTINTSFQVRVNTPGVWINKAQISSSSITDPDSTPGNGFANGEDDQAQTDIRCL
ncbi:hypothetical protein CWM47_00080 [Spirosoma pollinicola]|uniref:DUF11 domain-containing protein n=1 Tax=Spirosoma pollinicola TaxID=2057025 RepID=A0A2K8YRV9_9BACT|nr:hypothetical protein CWM47_00080 [Spirosoma pollinicola]